MISEQQRLDLLKVLSLVDIDMDKVISEMERLTGTKTTPAEIRDSINKLKSVRGY